MSCIGLKRTLKPEDQHGTQPKIAAVWEESPTMYLLQRQTVLQLSLQKLCHVPLLGRRVLITNTLRLIQKEISHQEAPHPISPTEGRQKFPQHQAHGVSLTPAWDLEHDLESDFVLKDSFTSALMEIEASATSSSSLSELEMHTTEMETSEQNVYMESHLDFAQPTLSHAPSPVSHTHLSSDDFLFSDLDNFLCELNPCNLNLSPSPGTHSKIVSKVTDDLVRSLTNQPFKTELGELEHIMEVVVES